MRSRTCSAVVLACPILVVLVPPSPAQAVADDPSRELHRLFDERYAWEMQEFPEQAMARGDYSNAARVTDVSLEAIERRHRTTVADLERLEAIDRTRLGEEDLVSFELFDLRLRNEIEDYRFRTFLMPVGDREGPQQSIPQMADGVRFEQTRDYEDYLRRLEQMPAFVASTIERLKLGLEEGRTPPRVAIAGMTDQVDALLGEDGLAALAAPFERLPQSIPPGARNALVLRFEHTALPAARDAIRALGAFVGETYLPACRNSIAATSLPDGQAFYAYQLRKMTTTDMTAREIHELGLAEVARIRAEMMEVIRRSDFVTLRPSLARSDDAALFTAFIEYLRSDPRFYHEDARSLLMGYRDICKRVDAWLPKLFRTLPRLPYGVREIPAFMAPQQTTAYYDFGSIENGEPGYFCANTYALDQRPTYEMIPLAMHEAVPGHHLQIAIAQELTGVPEFRKYMWFTAFGEGWALYSERLGIEMGLYENPYDDFGRLLYEMWRACRLVVDPGMHALGWSRREAIDFMLVNTALSEHNITTEVDRYIAWPGQACGYKIGELKIRALRHASEQRLGRAFDLRAFHDVVLGAGSVPLDVLERRVRDWIRSQPAGASYD